MNDVLTKYMAGNKSEMAKWLAGAINNNHLGIIEGHDEKVAWSEVTKPMVDAYVDGMKQLVASYPDIDFETDDYEGDATDGWLILINKLAMMAGRSNMMAESYEPIHKDGPLYGFFGELMSAGLGDEELASMDEMSVSVDTTDFVDSAHFANFLIAGGLPADQFTLIGSEEYDSLYDTVVMLGKNPALMSTLVGLLTDNNVPYSTNPITSAGAEQSSDVSVEYDVVDGAATPDYAQELAVATGGVYEGMINRCGRIKLLVSYGGEPKPHQSSKVNEALVAHRKGSTNEGFGETMRFQVRDFDPKISMALALRIIESLYQSSDGLQAEFEEQDDFYEYADDIVWDDAYVSADARGNWKIDGTEDLVDGLSTDIDPDQMEADASRYFTAEYGKWMHKQVGY